MHVKHFERLVQEEARQDGCEVVYAQFGWFRFEGISSRVINELRRYCNSREFKSGLRDDRTSALTRFWENWRTTIDAECNKEFLDC